MARMKRPGPMTPAVAHFSTALHDLHESAGLPSLSDLERALGKGVASRSRIHEAFAEPRLPVWGLIELLVEELASRVPGGPETDDEVRRFHALWLAASREQPPASTTPKDAAPTFSSRQSRTAPRPEIIGRIGTLIVYRAISEMGWHFQEQVFDYGIDAHVEIVNSDHEPTGQLFAVVIKTGLPYFRNRRGEGWVLRSPRPNQLKYLLGYALPVVAVLVDPDGNKAYWAHISSSSTTSRSDGWEVTVPENQLLGSDAAEALRNIATNGER